MADAKYLLQEANLGDQRSICEDYNGEKFMYLEGPFLGAEKRNRNGRIYKRSLIEREVNKFQGMIKNCEAFGELNHPDSAVPNPDRFGVLITKLEMDGDLAIGKARVLEETPCGHTIRGIIRGGGRLGMSSRGTGSLGADNIVCEDYNLITIDCVFMPSCPDAYVNAVNENTKWVLDESTNLYVDAQVIAENNARRAQSGGIIKPISSNGNEVIYDAGKEFNAAIAKNASSESIKKAMVEYINTIAKVKKKTFEDNFRDFRV